jgi:hypothetical protein
MIRLSLHRMTPPAGALLLLAGLLVLAPRAAGAQVRPDSTRRDSVAVPIPAEATGGDTIPRATPADTTARDSIGPAPNFPVWPRGGGGTWAGVWEWTREELQFYHQYSLLDLLERVPGLVVTRTGSFGQPAGVAAFATGGGRVRVFADGYELLPLGSATQDLQTLALADLGSVRVERGLAETRIFLTSFRLEDDRPYAQLEAGTGDFSSRILRGFFARTLGESTVLQVVYDVVDTNGFARRQPFSATTMGARLSRMFGPGRGVMLEYRRVMEDRDDRDGTTPFRAESVDRSDLVLRGTWERSALRLDAVAGLSRRQRGGADTTAFEGEGTQAGLTATYRLPFGTVAGTARTVRGEDDGFGQTATELSARADLSPLPRVSATGEVRSRTAGGEAGLEMEAAVRFAPLGGVSLFGEVAAGSRGIPLLLDSVMQVRTFAGLDTAQAETVGIPVIVFGTTTSSLNGVRAGAEWSRGSALLGAALVRSDAERVAPFGLAFDQGAPALSVGAMSGVEAYADVPLYWDWLRLDGWYLFAAQTGDRPYLAQHQGRGALQFRNTFFEGNLEPTARLEVLARGPARTLAVAENGTVAFDAETPTYAIFNFSLQVRILDVRLFFLAENVGNRRQPFDVAGLNYPGTRLIYGFRWFLRN